MENLSNQEQIIPNTSKIEGFEMQLNESGLTDAEEELFRLHDRDLTGSPQDHVAAWIIDAYDDTSNQSEQLKIVLGYIKRNLQNVAKHRGLSTDPEVNLDEDVILTDITMPKEDHDQNESESFEGLGPEQYKDQQKLDYFFTVLTTGMNAADTEEVANKFGRMNDNFRQIMTQYIPKIIYDIDSLVYENDTYEDCVTPKCVSEELIGFDDNEWIISQENQQGNNNKVSDFNSGWEDYSNSGVSDEDLLNYLKFVKMLPQLIEWKIGGKKVVDRLHQLAQEKKLDEFHNNREFMEKLAKIMDHDKEKHTYYFHGTQTLKDAHSITQQGLGIMRNDIETTAYPEFSMDDVILYERGFANEIGHDAIVLIDIPLDEHGKPRNIIEKIPPNYKLTFTPSGLQGLNGKAEYFIRPEFIVGIVDKQNQKIIFNKKYKEDNYSVIF